MNYLLLCLVVVLGCTVVLASFDQCNTDMNVCQSTFQKAVTAHFANDTAVCLLLNELLTCLNQALAPCDFATRSILMGAMQQVINIYTGPPFNCQLDFANGFEVNNCLTEVSKCAFYKFRGLEQKNDSALACRDYNTFVDCMGTNISSCNQSERAEIAISKSNATLKFRACPYACGRDDLVCTTTTDTNGTALPGTESTSTPSMGTASGTSQSSSGATSTGTQSTSSQTTSQPSSTDNSTSATTTESTSSQSTSTTEGTNQTQSSSTVPTTGSSTPASTPTPNSNVTTAPSTSTTTENVPQTPSETPTTKKNVRTTPFKSTNPEKTTRSSTAVRSTSDFPTPNYNTAARINISLWLIVTAIVSRCFTLNSLE